MCGITGAYSLRGISPCSIATLRAMTRVLQHRGPDDHGVYLEGPIAFGHRRLSILDLSSKGKQPMTFDGLVITYNGEIYNFKEIRKELEKKGHLFSSDTDTEVILHAYREWGISCLDRLNGMFAFALYDEHAKKLVLVRDRLGIKPLFYTQQKDLVVFGSEIKSLLAHPEVTSKLNVSAISSYLSYRYPLGTATMFQGIEQVEPGTYIELSGRDLKRVKYWDIPLPDQEDKGEKYYVGKVRALVTDAVESRMVSDVPLGAYLSGGLDSSIIVATMAKEQKEPVRTYSIAFDHSDFNELRFAKQVAHRYKTKHTEIKLKADAYLGLMKHLIKQKDSPLAVPNEIAIYQLSKELKKNITVVLSGEGADEIFMGYGRIMRSPFDYSRMMLRRLIPSLREKYGTRRFSSELDHFLFQYDYFPDKQKLYTPLLRDAAKGDAPLRSLFSAAFDKVKQLPYPDRISYSFEKLHLPGLLARTDMPTMAVSVEARVPFVDHRLVEFMFSVPHRYKMKWRSNLHHLRSLLKNTDQISEKHDITKYILREAFKDRLPVDILRRRKQGFPVPLDHWLGGDFLEAAKKTLLSDEAKISPYIDQKALKEWIDTNKGEKQFGQRLWMLLNLEYFLEEYF